MNYRDFYESNGVDYDIFLQRMMGKEALIAKYIGLFKVDPTFIELEQAIALNDFDLVSFKAHTLKGIALNLNFEKLGILSMELVSSVRNGNTQDLKAQFDSVKDEYAAIMEGLKR